MGIAGGIFSLVAELESPLQTNAVQSGPSCFGDEQNEAACTTPKKKEGLPLGILLLKTNHSLALQLKYLKVTVMITNIKT